METDFYDSNHLELLGIVRTIGSIVAMPYEITTGIAAHISPEQDIKEMTIGELLEIRLDILNQIGECHARKAAAWLGQVSRLVECKDRDCESWDECPHSKQHTENEECQYVCGADEPCSKCSPVKAA